MSDKPTETRRRQGRWWCVLTTQAQKFRIQYQQYGARSLGATFVLFFLLWRCGRGLQSLAIANGGGQKSNSAAASGLRSAYSPAPIEMYLMDHLSELDLDNGHGRIASEAESSWDWPDTSSGCDMWKDPSKTNRPNYDKMQTFRKELHAYYDAIAKREELSDVRVSFGAAGANRDDICKRLEVHMDGLFGIFKGRQLSKTRSGLVEPLLPPMRHPDFCFDEEEIMSLEYLVHDFAAMCHGLQKHSRIIMVDMGASLSFGDNADGTVNTPIFFLASLFKKFGLPFDHIYAYEITNVDPAVIMDHIPPSLIAAWHWINVGVSTDRGSKLNPLRLILDNYTEEDLIIVKMDIDNANTDMETPLARQLLNEPKISALVDHFYFEHHVHLKELANNWNDGMIGSVEESLQLFTSLRKTGVAAHFWV